MFVLLVALCDAGANQIIQRTNRITETQAYTALLLSLCTMYFTPLNSLNALDPVTKTLAAAVILGLPFLCSGLVFSRAFVRSTAPNMALGVNILGAVLGGAIEYLSVIFGSNSLLLLAMAIYAR